MTASCADPFVRQVEASGHKWVILCDEDESPLLVLDADEFVRGLFLGGSDFNPYRCCHRPVVLRNPKITVGQALRRLRVRPEREGDDVIDDDLILLWAGAERRVVTGADLLGFILRGIATVERVARPPAPKSEAPRPD